MAVIWSDSYGKSTGRRLQAETDILSQPVLIINKDLIYCFNEMHDSDVRGYSLVYKCKYLLHLLVSSLLHIYSQF